jgi:hypothetical protein
MKTLVFTLFLGLFQTAIFSQKIFAEFDPPHLIWLDATERLKLAADNTTDGQANRHFMLQKAQKYLKTKPNPTDSIFYEGLVSNHPKRLISTEHIRDMEILYYLTWAYIVSQKPRFGKKAKAFLLAWAKNYRPTGNDVNENKLAFCFYAFETLKPLLSKKEETTVKTWLHTIAKEQMQNWNPKTGSSNRHVKRAKMILMGGIVLQSDTFKTFALEKIDTLIRYAILPDGKTQDLIRRDAMHYHTDCLAVFIEIHYLTRLIGLDLYHKISPNGASLARCMDYMLPYLSGEKVHKEWVNTTIELDKKRFQEGDEFYRPGKPWNPNDGISLMILSKSMNKDIERIFESRYKNQLQNETFFNNWVINFTQK